MTDGAEQNEPSSSSAPGDGRTDNAPHLNSLLGNDGPGAVGLALSSTNGLIHDLDSDKTIPREERDLLRLYYTGEQAKLQLKLTMLGETEKIKAIESEIEKARQDLDSARSTGSPEGDESGKAKRYSLNEKALIEAKSKLQKAFSALEHLCQDDAKHEAQKPSASSWESTRKWQAITPADLQPAIEAIRHAFENKGCWRSKQSTMKLCFAALHPSPPNSSSQPEAGNLNPYRHFLVAFLGSQVEKLLLGANQSAPAIFKSYLDVLQTALKIAVRASFDDVLEIGAAQIDVLSMHPVEWAKRHLEILVVGQKAAIRVWTKEVCDPMKLPWPVTSDDMFWGSWRAPRLIHMKPSGNTRYDQATEWTREELVLSEELLEGIAERFTDFLRIDLDEVARAAHVALAKQDGSRLRSPRQEESNRANPLRSTPPLVAGKQAPDFWRSLHETFRALAEEELRLASYNRDRWLRAYVDYQDKTIECGQWHLSGGVNETFRERFEVEATRAGIALSSTMSGEAGDVWLHYVFMDLLDHKSRLLSVATAEGGIIERVCEGSALHCARLEKRALVEGRISTSSAVQSSAVASASSEGGARPRVSLPDDPRDEARREAVIKKVQNPNRHTVLTIAEAVLYFEVKPRTIYRWCSKGILRGGGRRGSITIDSVVKLEKKRSRKRREP